MPQKPLRPNPPPPKCVDSYGSPCRGCPDHPHGVGEQQPSLTRKMMTLFMGAGIIACIAAWIVSEPVKYTVQCPDQVNYCPNGQVCTPDSKECTMQVNMCDNGSWCTGGKVCTPDNKSCVVRVNYCPDREHFCVNQQFCSNDSDHCFEEHTHDVSVLPIFIAQ